MEHITQVALARKILRHLDAGTTALAEGVARNRAGVYTDPARLEREWPMIRRAPQFFGFSCRLPAPGSYATDDEAGVPVLLVRGEDGRVRSFLNVCRHRGARVASGHGAGRRTFACPYHGWTYDCRGRLAGVPNRESFAGLDLSGRHLVELPAQEHGGMLWSVLDPSLPLDLDAFLAGLAPELASYRLGSYVHYARRTLSRRMNWKMIIDTFLESYHFPALHPQTVHPLFFPDLGLFDSFGPHLREVFARRTITELKGLPESDWDLITHTAIIYLLFPSTVIVMQGDHAEIWRIFPDGDRTDASRIHLDLYVPEPADTRSARGHWDRNLDLVLRTVEEEDFPTGEGIQRNFRAGPDTEIVYGRNEPALQHWQRTVAEALARGPERGPCGAGAGKAAFIDPRTPQS